MADTQDAKLESMVQGMIDAKETPENIDAAIHLYKEEQNPTLSEMKGVVEGILPGAWGAIRGALYDLPKGVIDDALAMMKGETPEASKAFIEGIAKAPQEFMDASHEERGKMIGNLLGSMGVAKYAPMSAKPIAKGVGMLAEKVGTTGAWPIRMMGAHQLGSGNPMGIPIMAIPEVLKKGGQALQKFGNAETDAAAIEKFYGGKKPPVPTPKGATIMENAPDMWDRAKAGGPMAPPDLPAPGGITAAERAKFVKQGYSPELIAKIEQSATAAARPNVTPASLPLQQPKGATLNPVAAPNPMGGAPVAPPVSGGGLVNPRVPPFNRNTMETLTGSRTGGLENLTPGEMPAGAASDMEEAIHNAPHTYGRTEPTEPLGPANKPTTSIEQELLNRPNDALGRTAANRFHSSPADIRAASEHVSKLPVGGNVPASKSKRGPMSATPGLTVEDAKSLGLNPNNRIVGLTPDAIEKLLLERAQRSGAYRTDAGLNTGANKAVALDEP